VITLKFKQPAGDIVCSALCGLIVLAGDLGHDDQQVHVQQVPLLQVMRASHDNGITTHAVTAHGVLVTLPPPRRVSVV
jgi:hypothetical protein